MRMKVESTNVTNLVRNADSGVYYLRAKIHGKLIWRSLETESFSVAKLRKTDMEADLRKNMTKVERGTTNAKPSLTFRDAAELYREHVATLPRVKTEAARTVRMRSLVAISRTWPEVLDMELRRVTEKQLMDFMHRYDRGGLSNKQSANHGKVYTAGNSPSQINKMVEFFRNVFEIGIKLGIMHKNPAKALERKPVGKKLFRLPSTQQFAEMVKTVRASPGWGRVAGDLMEGLAYSGMRVGESRRMHWEHLNYDRGMMTVFGTKSASSAREIPMLDAFRVLTLRIKNYKTYKSTDRVFQANVCQESLKRACEVVGVKKMTHHDLRHLFATTCIEAGVDIPTVALWLGHKDGGVLAMRTYGHIRPSHSTEAAKKVQFA